MRTLAITLAVLFLCLGTAAAKHEPSVPADELPEPGRSSTVFWFDDMEGDVSQYTTIDFTALVSPHFHVDTYMVYEGTHSWWCGNFDYDSDGGYGNGWDDRLVIPEVDLSGATYPILTYAFRHDSEVGCDFTYVQAESHGVYVDLTQPYDGAQPWQNIAVYGFIIADHDNPLIARFRFISDGANSDEDGLYVSDGGAFMCDIIKVFDYFGGYTYFYDDAEGGGLCTPSIPGAAGDYWHVIDDPNPAYSDPHSWWCGDDAYPNLVPPRLVNGLYTPVVDLVCATECTVHFAIHFAIPTVDNDFCGYYGTCDGVNYYSFGTWWGDMGLTGWDFMSYAVGYDVGQLCSGPHLQAAGFLWVMHTPDNGCGPSSASPAGIAIDDVWMEGIDCGTGLGAAEELSWGHIKAIFR